MPASNIPTTVYIVTTWVNDETPLSSTNMNHIEQGLLLTSQRSIANHNNIELILEAITSLFQINYSNNSLTISFGDAETFPFRVSKTIEINTHGDELNSIAQFLDTYFDETKIGYAKHAIEADSAEKDSEGNVISDTYATKESVTNIKNGTETVGRAISDEDNNQIKSTYIKKSQIVNSKDSSQTDAPLSANIGKELKADILASGHSIILNHDPSTHKISAILKDANGNTISTSNVIDLPIENLVLSVDYISSTKKLKITLQDQSTIEVPLSSLLNGLVNDSRTIAGLPLTNDIATNELKNVLGIFDLVQKNSIIDNLSSNDETKPLSAKMGYELNQIKINKSDISTTEGFVTSISINGIVYQIAKEAHVTGYPKGVQSIDDLPEENDHCLYLVADDGYIYYHNGTNWTKGNIYTTDLLKINSENENKYYSAQFKISNNELHLLISEITE